MALLRDGASGAAPHVPFVSVLQELMCGDAPVCWQVVLR